VPIFFVLHGLVLGFAQDAPTQLTDPPRPASARCISDAPLDRPAVQSTSFASNVAELVEKKLLETSQAETYQLQKNIKLCTNAFFS